jgi:hypothetical protein
LAGAILLRNAATQLGDLGLKMVQFLLRLAADLSLRVLFAGNYERSKEVVECTAIEYAQLFPGSANQTVAFLPPLVENKKSDA